MPVQLNHTIVWTHDNEASARFIADLLGLPEPDRSDPFRIVRLENDVTLDFMDSERASTPGHYCFLITEREFDEVFGRIRERGLDYWADPFHRDHGRYNTNDGGRGLYFADLDGHNVEIITRPYGSG